MSFLKRSLVMVLALCMLASVTACKNLDKDVYLVNTEGMTPLQKAVVVTAESYYLRGNYAQYDMSNFTASDYYSDFERRLVGEKAPEDYTAQNTGFTDCSGFVFDVYKTALGMEITAGSAWTKGYCDSTKHTVLKEFPINGGFDSFSDEQLKAKEDEFKNTLQPGDIMVYRNAGDTGGHAMLYVGNGMMIHSSGSSYNYEQGKENFEEKGTYLYESIDDTLLNKEHKRYLANHHVYVILRPIDNFDGEIPENTVTRTETMRGIVAEKLSSHTYGQTVNPGDEMTFTFRIKNDSKIKKTVTVKDTVPMFTEYISGADKVSDKSLEWEVKLAAGETKEVSYKVKVKDGEEALGQYITSDSSVCGIPVNCPKVKIAKTLSETQQNAVKKAMEELKGKEQKGIALINAVYEKACKKAAFTEKTVDELWSGVLDPWSADYVMSAEQPLSKMIAPNLYGGRMIAETITNNYQFKNRTRMVKADLLTVGDILVANEALYMFMGDALIDLEISKTVETEFLSSLPATKRFVVLRPSMGF